jgi:hypothetical protein
MELVVHLHAQVGDILHKICMQHRRKCFAVLEPPNSGHPYEAA